MLLKKLEILTDRGGFVGIALAIRAASYPPVLPLSLLPRILRQIVNVCFVFAEQNSRT